MKLPVVSCQLSVVSGAVVSKASRLTLRDGTLG